MSEQKTRANVPLPKSRQRSFLPSAPSPEPVSNMKREKTAPMSFNMPKSWHTRFKMTAAQHDMSMKELMVECFAAWEREQQQRKR